MRTPPRGRQDIDVLLSSMRENASILLHRAHQSLAVTAAPCAGADRVRALRAHLVRSLRFYPRRWIFAANAQQLRDAVAPHMDGNLMKLTAFDATFKSDSKHIARSCSHE